MECTGRIGGAWVQVVAVFEADGANDALPVQTAANRVQSFVDGIIREIARETNSIDEKDHRYLRGKGLLELDGAKDVRLRTHNFSLGVARRGFAFLVTTNGILAAREKALVKGNVLGRGIQRGNQTMAHAGADGPAPAER